MDCSLIGYGINGLRKKLTFAGLYPKVFDGLGCEPFAMECLEVLVQFVIGDVSIRVVNICEKVKIGDAGETDKIIAEFIHGDT